MKQLRSTDAPTILARYRRELVKLANEYVRVVGPEPRVRKRLALRMCAAVTHHLQILEELCIPSVRTGMDVLTGVDETGPARNAQLRQLAAHVETAPPEEPLFDANMRALLLALSVHLAWEETEFVPRMFASDTNLEALATQMTVRSRELRAADAIRRPALPSAG